MGKYHDVLGVPEGASEDEIKKRYRILAKECHPDANPDDPKAEERFREISEAYDGLKKGLSGDHDGLGDDVWGGPDPRNPRGGFHFHNDMMYQQNLAVPIDMLHEGGDVTVTISVPTVSRDGIGMTMGVTHKTVDISIDPETKVGTSHYRTVDGIKIKITLLAAETDGFTPQGLNLFKRIYVDALDAIVDPMTEVITPTGKKYRFDITQEREDLGAGDMLRLQGCGLEAVNGQKGDLYISVVVQLPSLSEENKNIVKEAVASFK